MMRGQLNERDCRILLDCGANCSFVSQAFAQQAGLQTGGSCGTVELADGHSTSRPSRITKAATLKVGRHKELVRLTTTPLKPSYDVLLGMPWLQNHDPAISWARNKLLLQCGGRRVIVPVATEAQLEGSCTKKNKSVRGHHPVIQTISAQRFAKEIKCKGTELVLFVIREHRHAANMSAAEAGTGHSDKELA